MVKIKHSAIITKEGLTILGKTHYECVGMVEAIGHTTARDGFITTDGRFVEDRQEAMGIARMAGQMPVTSATNLLSYMLIHPHMGNLNYDKDKGYYK